MPGQGLRATGLVHSEGPRVTNLIALDRSCLRRKVFFILVGGATSPPQRRLVEKKSMQLSKVLRSPAVSHFL